MKKGLRSRLAQYGDEEFALFLRRGFLKGAGFTDEALDRPIVGILFGIAGFAEISLRVQWLVALLGT